MPARMPIEAEYDVVILGAGLAGLALCRQLLLAGFDKKILLLDNRSPLPGSKQKVGESLVQAAGYYFARVLDLEEHLLQEHYPKYNLRFHWKTPDSSNQSLGNYSVSYIRTTSNIGTYQLNRNSLEEHMLAVNVAEPNVTLCAPATGLDVALSSEGKQHEVRFSWQGEARQTRAAWVIDTTGRGQMLKRSQDLSQPSPIRHGSSWCWVEGLVNIEKLTDLPRGEIRKQRDRQKAGLFPMWLATNHFCGEGFWFWVIPLHGITSLGVVYDKALFPAEKVNTAEKLIEWVCQEFPLFRDDLPPRKITDSARLGDYAYDCKQTIDASGWAMSGMSGRFSDPLYSPGSDLIAFYNTMITDAIMESDPAALRAKCELYEPLMRILYDAYVPSYAVSYDVLGDQEVFTLKYSWELAVYFAFYAFPFINDLFTDARFIRFFFRKFALLGPINRNMQEFLTAYYRWKLSSQIGYDRVSIDFKEHIPLKEAEMSYYAVTETPEQAEEFLEGQLTSLKQFARFILAYVSSIVLEEPRAVTNRAFVESLRLRDFAFDVDQIRQRWAAHAASDESYPWTLDAMVMERFRAAMRPAANGEKSEVPPMTADNMQVGMQMR